MFDLSGKCALVTGSSRGIGRSIALALAAQGADVALHCHTRRDDAERVAHEIEAIGRRAVVLTADARDMAQMESLWREAEGTLDGLEILVNNAGLLKSSFLAMTSEAAWDEVMDVNLKAAFVLSKSAAKSWSRSKTPGRIINLASRAGEMGDVMRAPYCAAKAGLIGLTKATARELARIGATCNAISPGFVETGMTASDAARLEAQVKLVPLGRLVRPEEVAALAVYLASNEAGAVTGQSFGIDGGLRM